MPPSWSSVSHQDRHQPAGMMVNVVTCSVKPGNWSGNTAVCAPSSRRQPGASSLTLNVDFTSRNSQHSGLTLSAHVDVIRDLSGGPWTRCLVHLCDASPKNSQLISLQNFLEQKLTAYGRLLLPPIRQWSSFARCRF